LSRVVWVTGKVARITSQGPGLGIYVPAKLQGKLEPLRGCKVLVLVIAGDCGEGRGSETAEGCLQHGETVSPGEPSLQAQGAGDTPRGRAEDGEHDVAQGGSRPGARD
jgi:hypothetical protein